MLKASYLRKNELHFIREGKQRRARENYANFEHILVFKSSLASIKTLFQEPRKGNQRLLKIEDYKIPQVSVSFELERV